MLSEILKGQFRVVLRFPDLGSYFSEWFDAFPIWDRIFPSGLMPSRFGIAFFRVVLRFPDLGSHFPECFYAFPIWDRIFPSVFTLSQFGIAFFRVVLQSHFALIFGSSSPYPPFLSMAFR